MSILENLTKYKGGLVFFYTGKMNNTTYTLGDLHQSSLDGAKDNIKNTPIRWWTVPADISNAERIRQYSSMIETEHEIIKMYVANGNPNIKNRLLRLIDLNRETIDFTLSYINRLYWYSMNKDAQGHGTTPIESSGLTLEQCTDLVMPVIDYIDNINSKIMNNEMPHKIVSELILSNIKSENMRQRTNAGILKNVGKNVKHHKKEKKEKEETE